MEVSVRKVEVRFIRRYVLAEKVCPQCGAAFEGPRVRRYCSVPCQRAAAWKRNGPACKAQKREKEGMER